MGLQQRPARMLTTSLCFTIAPWVVDLLIMVARTREAAHLSYSFLLPCTAAPFITGFAVARTHCSVRQGHSPWTPLRAGREEGRQEA